MISEQDLERESFAVLSSCGKYRYWLHRRWAAGKGWTVFVMLNPSTADVENNDPTIRRCIGFAKAWGSMGIIVVNMYAARTPYPDLLLEMEDPIGHDNDRYISVACYLGNRVVCGWGTHRTAFPRMRRALNLIKKAGRIPWCLAVTKNGMPQHPLYVDGKKGLERYSG